MNSEAKGTTQNHIDYLLLKRMVELCGIGADGATYRLTPKGRAYVVASSATDK